MEREKDEGKKETKRYRDGEIENEGKKMREIERGKYINASK